MKKVFLALMMGLTLFSSEASFACGSHGGCGGGFGIGPRPLFVGGGAIAFRRSRRLAFRAQRAASRGFFGRANRLQFRSERAFNRGVFRNQRFNRRF